MNQVKDTARATVRLGFDGRVHKTFRGPRAAERFANEVRVLQFLETRGCPFVPRLLESDPGALCIVTTNCGSRVERMDNARVAELFDELAHYGVRHDDPYLRNITYSPQLARFCLIDFEFATILDEAAAAAEKATIATAEPQQGADRDRAASPSPAEVPPSSPVSQATITDHR